MKRKQHKPVQVINDLGTLSAFIGENRQVIVGTMTREQLIEQAQHIASKWNATWPQVNARVSS